MVASFRGHLPADRLYDTRYDMWVKREGDAVIIGATGFGIHLAGTVIAFTAKPRGAEVDCGRGLGTVECAKTVIAVHAPISFVLDAANEAAEEQPQRVNDDPYGAGWMVRGRPLAWEVESARLVDVARYAEHVRTMDPGAEILA
jgi:glycine cleavage system H protein